MIETEFYHELYSKRPFEDEALLIMRVDGIKYKTNSIFKEIQSIAYYPTEQATFKIIDNQYCWKLPRGTLIIANAYDKWFSELAARSPRLQGIRDSVNPLIKR